VSSFDVLSNNGDEQLADIVYVIQCSHAHVAAANAALRGQPKNEPP
jgi:hypothetical protein